MIWCLDDLGISSMHLSGKLFQMIDNKNKTMIVEMKAPDFFSYAFSMFFTLSCLHSCGKNMLTLKWGSILFDPHNLPTIWFFIPQNIRRIEPV